MPFIRFLVSKRRAHVVVIIFLLGEIMLIYSYYTKKKLVYVMIIASSNHQPSSYFKCTKLNICLSCNIKSVSDTKYIFISLCNIYNLSQLLGGNT